MDHGSYLELMMKRGVWMYLVAYSGNMHVHALPGSADTTVWTQSESRLSERLQKSKGKKKNYIFANINLNNIGLLVSLFW